MPEMMELQLLWVALLAYLAAGSLAIVGVVMQRRPERAVLALVAAGLAVHALSLGLRWERLGHGPFISMFEVLSSNVFSLLAVFAVAYARIGALRPSAAVVMPIVFVMMGWLLVASPADSHLPATYHTLWLWVHVGLGKVFLGSVLVAVGISGIVLLRSAGIGVARFAALPDDMRLERLAFRFMVLGFIFETLMLVAGAIWAQNAWGRYWAWDPLETWAFMTWLALAFFLHLRATTKLAPAFGSAAIVGVFVLAFLTFFGVPFVSTAPHKGAI
jgi:ABC-type transport system involved in cytochrome c biogenesis permease subunit